MHDHRIANPYKVRVLNQLKNWKLTTGFTLVELLVVIAIIGILSTYGIYSFLQYIKTEQLIVASNEFENTLQQAKSLAAANAGYDQASIVGNNKCPVPASQKFVGYKVTITSSTQFSLLLSCIDSLGNTIDTSNSNHTIRGALSFTTGVGDVIFFHAQSGVVDLTPDPGLTPLSIVLTQSQTSQSKTITINKAGVITKN